MQFDRHLKELLCKRWGWSFHIVCVCFRHWAAIIKREFYESQTIPFGDPFGIEDITLRWFIFIAGDLNRLKKRKHHIAIQYDFF